MKIETEFNSNPATSNDSKLSRKLKAVVGYWIDYFTHKTDNSVSFDVYNQRLVILDDDESENYYWIYFRWLKLRVHYTNIFETLNLLERMMKNLDD